MVERRGTSAQPVRAIAYVDPGHWDLQIDLESGLPPCGQGRLRKIDSVILGAPEYAGCLKLQFEYFLRSIEDRRARCGPRAGEALNESASLWPPSSRCAPGRRSPMTWIEAVPRASKGWVRTVPGIEICSVPWEGPPAARSVTAGVHGDEYEGPAAVAEIAARSGRAGRLRGGDTGSQSLACPSGPRTSPEDGLNLARTFPGDHYGSSRQAGGPVLRTGGRRGRPTDRPPQRRRQI